MSQPCYFCQSQSHKTIQNLDQHSQKKFTIRVCTICQSGRTEFNFQVETLADYYPKTYFGTESKRFFSAIETLVRFSRILRGRYIVSDRLPNQRLRILDVGCGRALMLAHLRERGHDVYGTEFSDASSEHARSILGSRIRTGAGIEALNFDPKVGFDVISFWHVLEHLDAPLEYLKKAHSLLNSDGRLIVEVPNFNSLQSRLSRSRWIYTETPRHLFHFSPEGLERLLRTAGFSIGHSPHTFSFEYGFIGMIQGLLNYVCFTPNFLYYFLKNDRFKILDFRKWTSWFDLVMTVVLFPLAGFCGVLLELMSWIFGRGSVIRVRATVKTEKVD